MKYPNLREELVRCCRLMAAKGLVAGTEGNLSARDQDDTILMTPSGVNKGEVEPEMLVRLSLDRHILRIALRNKRRGGRKENGQRNRRNAPVARILHKSNHGNSV